MRERLRVLPKRATKPRKVISLDEGLALADYSGDGRVSVACFELSGQPAWLVMRHDDEAMVGAAPGVELGVFPLLIMAAKGAVKAVSAMAQRDPATGIVTAPAPPQGFSYGLVPASQAQDAPSEVGAVPVRVGDDKPGFWGKVAKVWPFHKQGQGLANQANANGQAGATVTLSPPPQGYVWALQPAAGVAPPAPQPSALPAPAAASAAALVPRATALRRGVDAVRQTGILDEPGEDDIAGLVDPRAYDTEGNGYDLRDGRRLDRVNFRRGDRVDQ